jgi:hypothetical protein
MNYWSKKMSTVKINERIIEGIRDNSNDDKVMQELLIDLIYEEAEHLGAWWWKDTYRKRIDNCCEDWEDNHEN